MPAAIIAIRSRGFLVSNSTLRFFPIGESFQSSLMPNMIDIEVFGPNWCPPTIPPTTGSSQAFCSVINSPNAPACNRPIEGSPLVTPNNVLVGILLNRGGCVQVQGNVFMLQYHNIGEFQTWINEISGAKIKAFSLLLILSSSLISLI